MRPREGKKSERGGGALSLIDSKEDLKKGDSPLSKFATGARKQLYAGNKGSNKQAPPNGLGNNNQESLLHKANGAGFLLRIQNTHV